MSFTINQRIQIVWFYAETKSVKLTQTKFREHFNEDRAPDKTTILRLVNKFLTTGSVHDLPRSGRKRTGRSEGNIDLIRKAVAKSPRRSVRRLSTENKVPRTTVHRILRKDLKQFPYKIQIKQKIKAADKRARIDFCDWISAKVDEKPSFLDNVWFTDEAHFHLSGHVNKQNMRFWGTENPHEVQEKPLHVEKCTACTASVPIGSLVPIGSKILKLEKLLL